MKDLSERIEQLCNEVDSERDDYQRQTALSVLGQLVFEHDIQIKKALAENEAMRKALEWLLKPDHPIGSHPELIQKARERAEAALAGRTVRAQ